MSFIEIEKLKYVYGAGSDRVALDEISLSIDDGEFVAILGANGSGKSTLAKHLNAILVPTSGRCLIDGTDTRDADRLWEIRSKVGMVFQNPENQIIAALVEDDVAFGPENLGLPPAEIAKRVDEALRAVSMEKFRRFAPHLLSGGQKQRVAIAGALAMRTRCLVLDEPTAMLDPAGRAEVIDTIADLCRNEGLTIILVTHFMEEAARASRILLMNGGRIAADGSPKKILSDVDAMKKMRLDVPVAAEVAHILRKNGIKLPDGIITDEELCDSLCR